MLKAIIFSVALLLCVCGLSDFIFFIKLYFIKTKHCSVCYTLVYLDENYTDTLRLILCKHNWFGSLYTDKTVAVISALTPEQKADCIERFNNDFIIFCDFDNIKTGCFNGEM